VSTTDPDARIMKTSDGGFAPSYNMQIATDGPLDLVADVRVTQDVNDKYQLLPAIEGVAVRWLRKPNQVVADGDFTTNLSVIQMAEREIDFFGSWNPGPAAKKHTEPDWRGIYPEFQRDAFRYSAEQDHYVCPEGKLLVFGKANKLPHGGEDRFYKASRADCGPCVHRERCCPGISKAGDTMLRKLLVGSAQYILGPFGPDTDLRRYGLRLCKRGGKNAKKRAAVAAARKLAVLLHWL